MIDIKFTEREKELLDRFNISYSDAMDYEMAESILDIADYYESLNDEEQYLVDSIVDKITTHPDW